MRGVYYMASDRPIWARQPKAAKVKRNSGIWVLLLFLAACAFGQTDSTLYVRQFPGSDVGTKVGNAAGACNANLSIPCILVLDPSLAVWPSGTMPTLAPNVSLWDFRSGVPGANIAGQPGNYAILNGPNTFTAGQQVIKTGTYTTPGLEIDGSSQSSGAPVTIVQQGSAVNYGSTLTTTAGNALLVVRASTSTVPAPVDNWDDTFTVIGTDTAWYNSNGGMPLTFYLATNIHGGVTSLNSIGGSWGSMGVDTVYELHSLNAVAPLDVLVIPGAYGVTDDVPNTFNVTTTGPNETLLAMMDGGCGGSGPTSSPALSFTPFAGGVTGTVTGLWTAQTATAGTYALTWTYGCGNYRDVLALRGGSIVQTANLFTLKDAGGTTQSYFNGAAHLFDVTCSSTASFYNAFAGSCTAGALANGSTATTQASGDNSTKVATTAYVDSAVGVAGASGSLGSSGYWTLPGGMTIEWGQVTPGNTTATAYTLPHALTTCYVAMATTNNGGGNPMYDSAGANCSATQVTVQASNSSLTVGWMVIGK
jgi:hypothetical protein